MDWQNYHHLYYFFTVVREGGVSRAAEALRLAQSTVSVQVKALEDSLGEKLFRKVGRKLVLSEVGQTVYRYAEEIFSLGQEMRETLRGSFGDKPIQFIVGITNSLPKLIAYELLQPAFKLSQPIHLTVKEDQLPQLASELALHRIDLVLSDAPLPTSLQIKAYNHLLGECSVSFFGSRKLKRAHSGRFPGCLEKAPFLMSAPTDPLSKKLGQWFDKKGLSPRKAAEFSDTALLKVFGQAGLGFFAAPSIMEEAIRKQYDVELIGRARDITEQFFAISVERKLRHAAVLAISETAKRSVF